MFLMSDNGRATKLARNIMTHRLSEGVFSIANILAMIAGPKSPITTKNAIAVPTRKPIILNSTHNLPTAPNVWNAKTSR